MKRNLKNLLSGCLIGSAILSSAIGGELENKILLKRNQNEKTVVYEREINDDLMNYSFVKPDQSKIYEVVDRKISLEEIKKLEISKYKTNTYLTIEKEKKGDYVFEYHNNGRHDLSELEKRRIPNSEEFFREDTKNTHIYFIYPPKSKLEITSQELEILDNKTEKVRTVKTKDYEDTEFYEVISKVSDFFEIYNHIKPKIKEEHNQELDNTRVNNLGYNQEMGLTLQKDKSFFKYLSEENPQVKLAKKIPGKAGKILKGTIFLSKVLMNETEKQDRKGFLKRGISEDWNVLQMPMKIGEEINFFRDNITKRKTEFKIEGRYDKYYIMISSLPYMTGTFRTQTSGIEDILIEVER